MAHGTVVTLLRRLEDRGLVKRRKADQGKAFVYRPTKAHARTFGPVVSTLMQRAFGGKPAALVASLFESRPPSNEEIDELEALVDRLRHEKGQPNDDLAALDRRADGCVDRCRGVAAHCVAGAASAVAASAIGHPADRARPPGAAAVDSIALVRSGRRRAADRRGAHDDRVVDCSGTSRIYAVGDRDRRLSVSARATRVDSSRRRNSSGLPRPSRHACRRIAQGAAPSSTGDRRSRCGCPLVAMVRSRRA